MNLARKKAFFDLKKPLLERNRGKNSAFPYFTKID